MLRTQSYSDLGGFSIYSSLLTQSEYDDLSIETKSTPKLLFVVKG